MACRGASTQLRAQWVAKDPSFFLADSEDSDQTRRMPRLIWVFAGRTLILLVLSCRGSFRMRVLFPTSTHVCSIFSAVCKGIQTKPGICIKQGSMQMQKTKRRKEGKERKSGLRMQQQCLIPTFIRNRRNSLEMRIVHKISYLSIV